MDLSAMIRRQIAADGKRGFPVQFDTEMEKYAQLLKDLIGLYGEIGEFSNLVKKVGLKLERPIYDGPTFAQADAELREELADTMIYLMRIAAIIETDLESDVLKKMAINEQRYRSLESE